MAKVLLSLSGIHPRSERTIQATQDWERGRIRSPELVRAFRDDVKELVKLQNDLRFDYVSDGQLTTSWQDLLTPITSRVKGIRKGPLVRWFNTNTFYYVPIVEGAISARASRLKGLEERALLAESPSRVALPDPVTFVECSDNRRYPNREDLVFAYCDNLLSPLLRALEAGGTKYVQFSAPGLVAKFRGERITKDELSQVGEGLRGALKGIGLRTGYHTFFADASRYLPWLFDLIPTDDVGFDLTETDPSEVSATEKGIIAGVANSRSSFVESPEDLVRELDGLPDKTRTLTLAPSSDLRYVPRVVADAKLTSLAEARGVLS